MPCGRTALEDELRRLDEAVPLRNRLRSLPYGKGRGHPAQLNLSDCFAYAIAKSYRMTLLFKGEDFDKTDIPPAAPSPLREVPA
jgi:uncharacterized protein with PIN domain